MHTSPEAVGRGIAIRASYVKGEDKIGKFISIKWTSSSQMIILLFFVAKKQWGSEYQKHWKQMTFWGIQILMSFEYQTFLSGTVTIWIPDFLVSGIQMVEPFEYRSGFQKVVLKNGNYAI